MAESNWIVALVSAAGGWIGAELTAVMRDLFWRWRLKKKVIDEIRQLYDETDRLWIIYSRALQAYGAGVMSSGMPMPLSNQIYQHHFKDAAVGFFTRVQRTHINMIYGYVDQLNEAAASLRSMQGKLLRKEIVKDDYDVYGDILRSAVGTLSMTRWHMWYHLQHPDFPVLEPNIEAHSNYLETMDDARKQIEKLIAEGKKLGPKPFMDQ